jgi:hypothetical protein
LSLETHQAIEPAYDHRIVARMTPVGRKKLRIDCPVGQFTLRATPEDCRFVAFALVDGAVVGSAFAGKSHLCAIEAVASKLARKHPPETLEIVCYSITVGGVQHACNSRIA